MSAGASPESLPLLTDHPGIEEIWLQVDGDLEDASPFAALPALKELSVYPDRLAAGLEFLSFLPPLDRLGLDGLQEVRDLSALTTQPGLTTLYLYGCEALASAGPLRHISAPVGGGEAGPPPTGEPQVKASVPRERLLFSGTRTAGGDRRGDRHFR